MDILHDKKFFTLIICLILIIFSEKIFATELTFEPLQSEVEVGSTITIDARIENVEDMRSYQLYITFDPERLQIQEFTAHDFLDGGFTIWSEQYNNNTGVAFVQAVIFGQSDGVTGSGDFATIVFEGTCITQTDLSYIQGQSQLVDIYGDSIPYSITPGVVNITEGIGPIIEGMPDVNFDEEGSSSVALDSYVSDVNYPDSMLVWEVEESEHISVYISDNHYAFFSSDADWFGTEDVVFEVTDPNDYKDLDTVSVTVNPVNDPPEISDIPNVTFDEDSESTINLSDYVSDIDDPDSTIVWDYTSDNSNIFVNIDDDNIATIAANLNFFGEGTITFFAFDSDSAMAQDTSHVTVLPVNDPPEIASLPDISFPEDQSNDTLDLDNYVSDPDNEIGEIDWTVLGEAHVDVTIDDSNWVTFTAEENWNGQEQIIFMAEDPDGDADSDTIWVTVTPVNDPPVVSNILPINFAEDSVDSSLLLDNFVSDIDNSDAEINWTFSGNTQINITISEDRRVYLSASENWFGSENITFIATDPSGLSDSDPALITVNSVNDPPEVSDLPQITFPEEGSNDTLDLDDYVSDVDHPIDQLDWSYSQNGSILVSIDESTHDVTFSAETDWNGTQTIVFTATDPAGDSGSDSLTVVVTPVNDAPVISNLPAISFFENESDSSLYLDDYVSDVDNSDDEMSWAYSGNSQIQVEITSERQVIFTAPPDWVGSELITFTASDPTGLSDSDSTLVSVVVYNGPPTISDIPDVFMEEDGISDTLDLDDYASDPDDPPSSLDWSYSGNSNISVQISEDTHIATFTPAANWSGSETIVFTVSDPMGSTDADTITVEVTPLNDPPVITNLPTVSFDEDTSDSLALDIYVSDVDNSDDELLWTYSGNAQITVTITDGRMAIFSAPENWYGEETITLTATDPLGLSDSDSLLVDIVSVNDLPVISDFPSISFAEDGANSTLDLDNYVSDIEDSAAAMNWSYSGNSHVLVAINDSTHNVTFSAEANWFGTEDVLFTATDTDGGASSDTVHVSVTPVNDPPELSDLPNIGFVSGETDSSLVLDNYVSDIDDPLSLIDYSYFGNDTIQVEIRESSRVILTCPYGFEGAEQINFVAIDTSGALDVEMTTVTVTYLGMPPVITDSMPDITFSEDGSDSLSLNLYVEDPDHSNEQLTWSASWNQPNLFVDIQNQNAYFSAAEDWHGENVFVKFTVTDPDELSDSDSIFVTIQPVNDPPVISDIDSLFATEDEAFSYQCTASDVDGDSLLFSDNTDLFDITPDGFINFTPEQSDVGNYSITVSVSDGEYSDQTTFSLVIEEVNDAPELETLGSWLMYEDSLFVHQVQASDEEGDSLTFYDNTDIFDIDPETGLVSFVPVQEDVGLHNATIGVSDGESSTEEQVILIIEETPDSPVITPIPDMSTNEDTLFVYYVVATDEDGQSVVYSDSTDLFNINPNTGKIMFTPDQADVGEHEILVAATDPTGLSDTEIFTLTIENVNDPPILQNLISWTAYEDSLFEQTVTASDEDGDTLNFYDDTDIFDIDPITGLVSFVPIQENVGQHQITIGVTDGEFSDEDEVTLTIVNSPDAPVIDSIPDMNAYEDSLFLYYVSASDEDGHAVTFSDNTDLFTINPNTGKISFTPEQEEVGIHEIEITATDPTGLSDADTFLLTIENTPDSPVISPIPDQDAWEDSLFQYTAEASDPDGDSLTFYDDTDVFDIDPQTGVISFVPTQEDVGVYQITISVFDGMLSDSTTFDMEIYNVNDAPEIVEIPDMETTEDSLFNYVVEADDEDSDELEYYDDSDMFQIDHQSGEISFVPLQEDVGIHEISVWATDGFLSDTTSFYLEIINVNDPPEIEEISDTQIYEDELWSYTVSASDEDGDSLAFSDDTDLFDIDEVTGEIEFTPEQADVGIHEITIYATDGELEDFSTFNLEILNTNDAPAIDSIPDLTAYEDSLFAYQVVAADEDGDSLTYDDDAYFFDIDPETGLIEFVPMQIDVGEHLITVWASDGSLSDSTTFELEIMAVNDPPIITDLPDIEFDEDDSYSFDLDDYVEDEDDLDGALSWEYEILEENVSRSRSQSNGSPSREVVDSRSRRSLRRSNGKPQGARSRKSIRRQRQLTIEINPGTHVVTFTPAPNWFGEESVVFTVTDPDGESDSDTLVVTVISVNDPPVVSGIPDLEFNNDDSTTVNLNDFVVDVDHDIDELSWTYEAGTDSMLVAIDDENMATIQASGDYAGEDWLWFIATDPDSASGYDSLTVTILPGGWVNMGTISDLPKRFSLRQNYPNPFNPSTTIAYQIPVGTYNYTTLRIYDTMGRLIKTLVDERQEAGHYSVIWNGHDDDGKEVSSGIYFYRLEVGAREQAPLLQETKRMVLLK